MKVFLSWPGEALNTYLDDEIEEFDVVPEQLWALMPALDFLAMDTMRASSPDVNEQLQGAQCPNQPGSGKKLDAGNPK